MLIKPVFVTVLMFALFVFNLWTDHALYVIALSSGNPFVSVMANSIGGTAVVMTFIVFTSIALLEKKTDEQQTQIDDLKRELEEMKRKE